MEPVTFRTAHKGIFQLRLKRELKTFAGNEIHLQPQTNAVFEKGVFQTSDEETANLVRQSMAFLKGEIWEVTERDKRDFLGQQHQAVIRGAVSTAHFEKEMEKEEPIPQAEAKQAPSQITVCPVCNKEFTNDLGNKKFKMHMISHRPGAGKKLEEQSGEIT